MTINRIPLLPPLTTEQIQAGARIGESWEEASRRLERERYAVAPAPCVECGYQFLHYAHEKPQCICCECEKALLKELDDSADAPVLVPE